MLRYLRKLYGDPSRIAPGTIEGYTAGLDVPGSFEHLLRIVRSWHRDLALIEKSLPAISELPTLLLWGSRDTAVYPSSADTLQSRLKNSALVMLDGVGHVPYEEVPDEVQPGDLRLPVARHPANAVRNCGRAASLVRVQIG